MTLPSDLPPELAHRGVRPADRLGFTLFLAALIHLALLLGVGFTMVEPKQISKTLEITLATFKSEKKPEKADFLAQAHGHPLFAQVIHQAVDDLVIDEG